MKGFPECVALLGDVVRSRNSDRSRVHDALLAAIDACNDAQPPLDPLRVTVGDEIQGVYATLGQAVAAMLMLRDELLGTAEVRCGLGGGQVHPLAAAGLVAGSGGHRTRGGPVTATREPHLTHGADRCPRRRESPRGSPVARDRRQAGGPQPGIPEKLGTPAGGAGQRHGGETRRGHPVGQLPAHQRPRAASPGGARRGPDGTSVTPRSGPGNPATAVCDSGVHFQAS